MEIREYIGTQFNGSQVEFARQQGVNPQQVTRWIKSGYIVLNQTIYSPLRALKTMITITNQFNVETASRFPLHCKHDNQHAPQPAYISLDLRTGAVDADYSDNSGGVPVDVWEKKILRFAITPMIHKDELNELIVEHSDDFKKMVELYQAEKYSEVSDDEFTISEKLSSVTTENFLIDDLNEWLVEGGFPDSSTTLAAYVDETLAEDGYGNQWFPESLLDASEMKDSILNCWANWLYDGEEIPAHVAKMLIENGTCADSQWMDTLKEFAAA